MDLYPMLFHPHTLSLILRFKLREDESILKEIVALLIVTKTYYQEQNLSEILFSHLGAEKSKSVISDLLISTVEKNFTKMELVEDRKPVYVLKDFDGISMVGTKLIRKRIREFIKGNQEVISNSLDGKFTEFESLLDDLKDENKIPIELKGPLMNVTGKIASILGMMLDAGFINKKEHLTIANLFKSNPKSTSNGPGTPQSLNLSLLNFVTKEKRKAVELDTCKNFKPIVFDSNVYVYKINNPNFVSIRQRKDLVNPKKMLFIKFAEDVKPPIYRHSENKLTHKISYQKIFNNIDYDEESTWEDDPDAESIDSVETEEEESSSEANEFIEEDSGEQERRKIKKPSVTYPNLKIELNEEFDPIFWELPITPVKTISTPIKRRLESEFNRSDEPLKLVKKLSKMYMVTENSIRGFYLSLK